MCFHRVASATPWGCNFLQKCLQLFPKRLARNTSLRAHSLSLLDPKDTHKSLLRQTIRCFHHSRKASLGSHAIDDSRCLEPNEIPSSHNDCTSLSSYTDLIYYFHPLKSFCTPLHFSSDIIGYDFVFSLFNHIYRELQSH